MENQLWDSSRALRNDRTTEGFLRHIETRLRSEVDTAFDLFSEGAVVPRTKNELLVHACPRGRRGAAEPLETGYSLAAEEIVIAHDVLRREVKILHSRCCMLAAPEAIEARDG